MLQDVTIAPGELTRYLKTLGPNLFTADVTTLLTQFERATTFGSLIRPVVDDLAELERQIERSVLADGGNADNLFLHTTHQQVQKVLRMARYLSPRYQVVVANPPYMGSGNMNAALKKFAKDQYPESKSDLGVMFVERGLELVQRQGYSAMVTMQSWMFLSSYEKLRETLLGQHTILAMAHLGARAFDSIGGEVVQTTAFVVGQDHQPGHRGAYMRLVDEGDEAAKEDAIRRAIHDPDCGWLYPRLGSRFPQSPRRAHRLLGQRPGAGGV